MGRIIVQAMYMLIGIVVLTGCADKKMFGEQVDEIHIDKIQVVEAIGNPAYGAESKVMTNREEIEEMVAAFNTAKVGKKVKEEDLGVGDTSSYYFFEGDIIVKHITCNVNDSSKVWIEDAYYDISYEETKTPFELYTTSKAPVVSVDKDLNEIIRPLKAEWTLDQMIGVTMPELDYASENKVIFHGYFGLFIYDLEREDMLQSLDLESIGCQWAQGSNYCEVEVSEDGNIITLHPMESEEMYRYTVDTQILEKLPYIPMEKPFQVVLNDNSNGAVSFGMVAFEEGESGYLEAQSDTLDGLYYRCGEKQYKLFKE